MVSPFSSEVLTYLDAVHAAPRPVGPASLSRVVRERTVYRWQVSLGSRLSHFPSVSLAGLGLVQAHLFLDGASERWLDLPVAFSASWVNHGLDRPGLYLRCAVPVGAEESLRVLVRSLAEEAWCDSWAVLFAGDSWQAVGNLSSVVGPDGRFRGGCESVPERVFRASGARDVLRSYPFIVPALFEAGEARCSLQEVWRRAYARLGSRVWSYLPRGTRRWPVNGKRYVGTALDRLVAGGCFRQNVIRYGPLLEHAVEVFVLVPVKILQSAAREFGLACPVVEVIPGADGMGLLRLTGDERLLYELLRIARDGTCPFRVWVHDQRHQEGLGRVRFRYEEFFSPATGTWRFSAEDVLRAMRGAS